MRSGALSERIAGGLILVIWQPHHQGFTQRLHQTQPAAVEQLGD